MADHDTYEIPQPDPALRRLDFLVGTWRAEGKTDPDFAGPPMTVTSNYSFEWLHGGFFLVQRWDAVFGDPSDDAREEVPGGAVQKGIMFYGYDAETEKYRTHFFDGNGPYHDGSTYEGEVVDGHLRFTGPARFTIVPQDDDTVLMDFELLTDGETYGPWMQIVLHRID